MDQCLEKLILVLIINEFFGSTFQFLLNFFSYGVNFTRKVIEESAAGCTGSGPPSSRKTLEWPIGR